MGSKNLWGLAGCAAALIAVAGCTPEARQDVGEAGANVNQAAEKSAAGTAEAIGKTGEKVAETAEGAAVATGQAVEGAAVATAEVAKDAGQAVEKGVAKTGQAVGEAAESAEKGVAKAGAALDSAGDALSLTPKVKNALLVEDTIKIDKLNVNTMADTKTVTLEGTAPNADQKKKAEAIAKKAMMDAKATQYKLVNKITVAGGKM